MLGKLRQGTLSRVDSMQQDVNQQSAIAMERKVTHVLRQWHTNGKMTSLYPMDAFPQVCNPLSERLFSDPAFQRKLGLACLEIERAVGFRVLKDADELVQARQVRCKLHQYQPICGEMLAPSFLVAGGWVVDRVFGFPPSSDMDVWFTPKYSRVKRAWILCCSKSYYKVNTILVACPWRTVESFDLHICQCAIHCAVHGDQRFYRLWLTPSCLLCVLQRWCHACGIHRCVAQQSRLCHRIDKYANRGLHFNMGRTNACDLTVPVLEFDAVRWQRGYGPGHWKIRVDSAHIKSISLSCDPLPCGIDLTIKSVPVIIYPCHESLSVSGLAFSKSDVHWLLRGLHGEAALVGLCGSGKVDIRYIKPEWICQRRHLTACQLIADMQMHLPHSSVPDNSKDEHVFYIACAYDFTPQFMWVDWGQLHPDTDCYDNMWSYTLACESNKIRAHMFCTRSHKFEDNCFHGITSQDLVTCPSVPSFLHCSTDASSSDDDMFSTLAMCPSVQSFIHCTTDASNSDEDMVSTSP